MTAPAARARRYALTLAIALTIFAAVDGALFWTGAYRAVLAPQSSTAEVERALARLRARPRDPARDVLVLGDSRILFGLDERAASTTSGPYRLIDAGVQGTTPRSWTVFDRALDPDATRYRAVVVPVDTYADDDGALASVDGNDRALDLRYVVFQATPSEILDVASSFTSIDRRIDAFCELALRGPPLRDDVQALVDAPLERYRALTRPLPTFPRTASLAGLRVDFARDTIVLPPGADPASLAGLRRQLLHRAAPSPSYAAYRREWLGRLVARYRARGVPVIFVRIPTRPLHRALPESPSGSIAAFGATSDAVLLAQARYVALERPDDFLDLDHLNAAGARAFGRLLGRDVRRVLDGDGASVRESLASASSTRDDASTPAPGAFVRAARAFEIGVPIGVQSYEFVAFLALVALVAPRLPARTVRRPALLALSWYFYARWNAWYLVVLLALTTTDYALARALRRPDGTPRHGLLVLGIGINLAFLATAKYADFVTGSLAGVIGRHDDPWVLHLLVPIGISFHTFQSISYLVDVSRGRVRAVREYVDYALYLAFFPQLLAGPIVRAKRFFGELARSRTPDARDVARGSTQIVVGLIKKSVIADRFAATSDAYFGGFLAMPGAPAAWCGAFAFGVQIYFDFSGYSDIAIGSARLLGFRFPANFRRPYLAWSITEFWRRWHMTLSAWLRDYLYVPLGGSRGGRFATVRNLMVTMLLGGLWHGANWTFVVWGAYHGLLLSVERLSGYRLVAERTAGRTWARVGTTLATFAFVLLGWVLFRAANFPDAAYVVRQMLAGGGGSWTIAPAAAVLVAIAIALELRAETKRVTSRGPLANGALAAVALLVLELGSFPGIAPPFVYFRF